MRVFLPSNWAYWSTFLIKELCLELVLQLGKLLLSALDLVSVLSLFVFYLRDLLYQVITFSYDPGHLSLVLALRVLHLVLQIYKLLGHLIIPGLDSLKLRRSILALLLCPIQLLPEFIPVVDIRNPLLEHVVY